jgi:TolA-binding protein
MKRGIIFIGSTLLVGLFFCLPNHAAAPSTQPATANDVEAFKKVLAQIEQDNAALREQIAQKDKQLLEKHEQIGKLKIENQQLQLELRTKQASDLKNQLSPFTLSPAIPQQPRNPNWNSFSYNGQNVYMVPLGQGTMRGTALPQYESAQTISAQNASPTTQKSK